MIPKWAGALSVAGLIPRKSWCEIRVLGGFGGAGGGYTLYGTFLVLLDIVASCSCGSVGECRGQECGEVKVARSWSRDWVMRDRPYIYRLPMDCFGGYWPY